MVIDKELACADVQRRRLVPQTCRHIGGIGCSLEVRRRRLLSVIREGVAAACRKIDDRAAIDANERLSRPRHRFVVLHICQRHRIRALLRVSVAYGASIRRSRAVAEVPRIAHRVRAVRREGGRRARLQVDACRLKGVRRERTTRNVPRAAKILVDFVVLECRVEVEVVDVVLAQIGDARLVRRHGVAPEAVSAHRASKRAKSDARHEMPLISVSVVVDVAVLERAVHHIDRARADIGDIVVDGAFFGDGARRREIESRPLGVAVFVAVIGAALVAVKRTAQNLAFINISTRTTADAEARHLSIDRESVRMVEVESAAIPSAVLRANAPGIGACRLDDAVCHRCRRRDIDAERRAAAAIACGGRDKRQPGEFRTSRRELGDAVTVDSFRRCMRDCRRLGSVDAAHRDGRVEDEWSRNLVITRLKENRDGAGLASRFGERRL